MLHFRLHLLLSLSLVIPLLLDIPLNSCLSHWEHLFSPCDSWILLGLQDLPHSLLGRRRKYETSDGSNSTSEPVLKKEPPMPFTTALDAFLSPRNRRETQGCCCITHSGPVTQSWMKIRSVNWRLRLSVNISLAAQK